MNAKEREARLKDKIKEIESAKYEQLKELLEYKLKAYKLGEELKGTKDFRKSFYAAEDEIKSLKKENERLKHALELERNGRGAGRKPYSNKQAVQLIFNSYYMVKSSLQTIANMLNSSDIKTSRGSSWSKSTVKYVLNNMKYVEMEYVEEEVFNNVQNMLNQNRKY
jgi:hypothetical protein